MLTGETPDDLASLTDRARALVVAIGKPVAEDPTKGLIPRELAGYATRTLALPEIVEMRPSVAPEFPVYASTEVDGVEQATAGITDAISFAPDGTSEVIIDLEERRAADHGDSHYRAQVRNYLDMIGTKRGLIVLMTAGEILPVTPTPLDAVRSNP